VALYVIHVGGLRGEGADPGTSVLSQMLMMSNVLAGQNLPNVVWSLSYEMIFYLLLTALFMARVERPMQDVGRRLARRLDARFGPDRFPVPMRAPEPVLAHSSRATE
jgi:peptidoglycan/LPS O-acetylase OafA/YrhL